MENGTTRLLPQEISGKRKRSLSDSDNHESFKRCRDEDTPIRPPRTELEPFPSLALNSNISPYDVISSLDFSLPPPVTVSGFLHGEELPQYDVFDYSDASDDANNDFNFGGSNILLYMT